MKQIKTAWNIEQLVRLFHYACCKEDTWFIELKDRDSLVGKIAANVFNMISKKSREYNYTVVYNDIRNYLPRSRKSSPTLSFTQDLVSELGNNLVSINGTLPLPFERPVFTINEYNELVYNKDITISDNETSLIVGVQIMMDKSSVSGFLNLFSPTAIV